MSAVKRHQEDFKNQDSEEDGLSQAKKIIVEPNESSYLASDNFDKIQLYVMEFQKIENENRVLRNLANDRLTELKHLQQRHDETLKQLKKTQLDLNHFPEKIVLKTEENKCLDKTSSALRKENSDLRQLLEDCKREIQLKAINDSKLPGNLPKSVEGVPCDVKSELNVIRDLRFQLKRATNEQNEMKLLLDMYKSASKDQKEKLQLIEAEKKNKEGINALEEPQQRALAQNTKAETCKLTYDSLLERTKNLETTVLKLQKSLTAQQIKEQALMTEMERTEGAFEELQEQNATLLQQVVEKDKAYFMLMASNGKPNEDQSSCPEKQDVVKAHVKMGVNVALAENGARLMNLAMQEHALDQNLNTFTTHKIRKGAKQDDQQGIVVKLSECFILNRIKFLLRDKDDRSYSYYIEISLNGKNWTRIWDYSMFFSRSWQFIVFSAVAVRYIKIVGTHSTSGNNFHVITLQAYLAKDKLQLDRTWNVFGLLVPKVNVATVNFGANVARGKGGNKMINGDLTRHLHNCTYQNVQGQPIVLQLSQPYVLDSMRFLLWDKDDRIFSYDILVSANLVDWELVAHSENEQSWQNLKFRPVPVAFIWIRSTSKTPSTNDFRIIHFECPLQSATS